MRWLPGFGDVSPKKMKGKKKVGYSGEKGL